MLSAESVLGTAGDDVLVARRSSDDTQIQLWLNADPNATAPTHTYSRANTTSFLFDGGSGDDKLILDCKNGGIGNPFHDGVLSYQGGDGSDTFEVLHHASAASRVNYLPGTTDADAGTIITGHRANSFDSVESIVASNVTTLTLTTPNMNDDLRIDSPTATTSRIRESALISGNIVFSPLSFSATSTLVIDTASNDGGTPGTDVIKVEGTGLTSTVPAGTGSAVATNLRPYTGGGTNTLTLSAGTLSLNAGNTAESGQTLDVIANAGTLTLTSTQYLKSLTLNGAAQAVLPAVNVSTNSPHKVLVLEALAIDASAGATATLDVADNAMIVRNGAVGTLEDHLQRGLNESAGVFWGGHGITSSVAAANPSVMTAAGLVRMADFPVPTDYQPATGQSMSNVDVLIKFTYFGDADMNGVLDATDYSLIDNGFNANLNGWINRDFSYNDDVEGTDYFLIDNAHNGSGANVLPTFTVSGNATADEGSTYTLTATASTGTNVPGISAWSLYWGDGSYSVHASDPETGLPTAPITHTYLDDGGPYVVQAFAKGQEFNYFAGETLVTVNNVAATLTVTGVPAINEGESYPLTLGWTAPPGFEVDSWLIEWGDGLEQTVSATTTNLTHLHDEAGAYSPLVIACEVNDGDCDQSVSLDLVVRSPSLDVRMPGAPDTAREGQPLSFSSIALGQYYGDLSYTWEARRDGSVVASGTAADFDFTPADNGEHTVTVQVSDGVTSGSATATFTVENVAPRLTISGPATVREGEPYDLELSRQDPGDDTLDHWTIAWGDGESQPAGTATTASHPFTGAGPFFNVTATGTDEDGTHDAVRGRVVGIIPKSASSVGVGRRNSGGETSIFIGWADLSQVEEGFLIEVSVGGLDYVPLASVGANTTQYEFVELGYCGSIAVASLSGDCLQRRWTSRARAQSIPGPARAAAGRPSRQ